MKSYLTICLLFLFCCSKTSSTLVDGIVTLTWSPVESALDRFLTANTHIKLTVLCRETTSNASVVREQIKQNKYNIDKANTGAQIHIQGRIGRVVACLPLQSDPFLTRNQVEASKKDPNDEQRELLDFHNRLWQEMEIRTFAAHLDSCEHDVEIIIDELSNITGPIISPQDAAKSRQDQQNKKNNSRFRRAEPEQKTAVNNAKASASPPAAKATTDKLLTWGDGYYIIEIEKPELTGNTQQNLDVDIEVEMKNRYGGYITADEHPALIFYAVMCGIYAFFAVLWFVWCAFYWRELLKVQFWIGGVILMGMIEKAAFLAEYDTVNRHGYRVHVAIVTAELLSCLKRTLSRVLVIIVALGYGIVKPRLGPLKQKVLGMGILYFAIAATEALIRLNTKNDEANNRVFISRIPLAVIDATIYYWIFTGLVATTRQLRLKKNIVKLNVYRHFTNTIIFAIVASLFFMIWSLKSHLFTVCVTNWREFWVDDAFWHILFSLILLVIMFLFRPSNNNQRYAFVPLLDHSDNDDDGDNEDDEEKGEAAVFDSITMRKANTLETGNASKNKKQQQALLNREGNVASNANGTNNSNGAVEDALTWVEDNIPTSIADQALQALDSEDEIVNTRLERSKMQ